MKSKNKRQKRLLTSIACLCLILILFFPLYIRGSTSLGESTFPVEEESEFVWESVNATDPLYMEIEFVKFKALEIYNQTYNGKNYLFMNYSLEFYRRFAYLFHYRNAFYMAYNKTLNFLNWSSEGFLNGNLFIFPTPVNLTLIGDAVEREGNLTYTENGEKIIFDYHGNSTTIEISINSAGISTIIEKITNGTTIYRWELYEEKIIIKVPFGSNYLIITIACIIPLVVITKKKIANSRKH